MPFAGHSIYVRNRTGEAALFIDGEQRDRKRLVIGGTELKAELPAGGSTRWVRVKLGQALTGIRCTIFVDDVEIHSSAKNSWFDLLFGFGFGVALSRFAIALLS